MNLSKTALLAASFLAAHSANATLVLTFNSGDYLTTAGAPLAIGTLFQLVNLGGNNAFDPINVNDGSVVGLQQWVSGDDSVIDIAVIGGDSASFPTTKAFDLSANVETAGVLDRIFEFATDAFPKNANFGIRWFPGVQASAFSGVTLQPGQSYGQFTRAVSKYGESVWNISLGDGNVTLDPLATASQGGTDPTGPTDDARAHFAVVPEPAAIGMSLIGAAGLALLRRRRA